MSESRKNHLAIDGAQVKEDDNEHIGTYKPIPESETELRTSKANLSKSKEKVSVDEAEEKLLQKEDEAKICTRVDMADAKYVVGDHRNGDAKIELDANKRQFAGLTKEELLKYADDPFWVRLRWCMFALFWVLWLCMLGGAIAIIVKAPKCAAPTPKTWYEKGPLADLSTEDPSNLTTSLAALKNAGVQAVFISAPTYEVLDDDVPTAVDTIKKYIEDATKVGVKVVVDLTANFVPKTHRWFVQSENRTSPYEDYFVWAKTKDYGENGEANPPNNWVSTKDTPAWVLSEKRNEFYLQLDGEHPNLNLTNPDVVHQFDAVIQKWMKAGAAGVRLLDARHKLVNVQFPNASLAGGSTVDKSAVVNQYAFYRHDHTTDQAGLPELFSHWRKVVDGASTIPEPILTMYEDGSMAEYLVLGHNSSGLSPAAAAALVADGDADKLAADINARVKSHWPLLQLKSSSPDEIANLAALLPAAPLLSLQQVLSNNGTSLSWWSTIRADPSVCHGERVIAAVPTDVESSKVLLVARWKSGHTGYASLWNAHEEALRANLTGVPSIPDTLTVYHITQEANVNTNYTHSQVLEAEAVLVPSRAALVLSYVPVINPEK